MPFREADNKKSLFHTAEEAQIAKEDLVTTT
jgi:hypothetical protein